MTRRARAAKHYTPDASAKSAKDPAPEAPVVTLKPQPVIFYVLLGVFVLWIALLVTLYFTTVYHKTDVHLPAAPTAK